MPHLVMQKLRKNLLNQRRGFEGRMDDWFADILAKTTSMDFKWIFWVYNGKDWDNFN
jgi:hypothetical protein